MKLDVKLLKQLIKEEQEKNTSPLLSKPPTMEDIKTMVSEVLDEIQNKLLEIQNENGEIIPGSLLEIKILYNTKDALGVPDTSIMYEGSKKFVYKITENNMIKKSEIEIGVRNQGNLEVLSGLNEGDKIIADGLIKVRPGMKVKPIIKSQ